jgi:hypothetical protein
MFFKQPQTLWFLFALAIPIIVHLFQLRRFKPEYFTNVRFLKDLLSQTRKSSKIKKYLLLASRLGLVLALVFMFAQPFFKANDSQFAQNELVFVVDNSLSMQAKGSEGELFKRTLENILTQVPEDVSFSLYTNDDALNEISTKVSQKEIQQLNYSPNKFSLDKIFLRLSNHNKQFAKDVVVFTDNKNVKWPNLNDENSNLKFYTKIEKSSSTYNSSIDSVYIAKVTDNFYDIAVVLKTYGQYDKELPISLFNQNKIIAKAIFDFNKSKEIIFTIPKKGFNGYVEIDDQSLTFDNTYYFSIKNFEKNKLVSVGNVINNSFLRRIYNVNEFDFSTLENFNFDSKTLAETPFILLNEVEAISETTQSLLKDYLENGGNLVFIPAENGSIDDYNKFFEAFGLRFSRFEKGDKKITKIAQQHPLFKGVFEKQIKDFQYPSVQGHFVINTSFPSIFEFENGQPLLTAIPLKSSQIYVFSAPLNRQNSTFIETPLVVPTFYNMAKMNIDSDLMAFSLGEQNQILVDIKSQINQVLEIKSENESFIPLQQMLSNKIKLNFIDYPVKPGNFDVFQNKKIIQPVSFNYSRSESNILEKPSDLPSQIIEVSSISEMLEKFKKDRTTKDLWRWFLFLALLFLIAEIFIQKYVK